MKDATQELARIRPVEQHLNAMAQPDNVIEVQGLKFFYGKHETLHGIDLPIARQMKSVLYEDKPPREAVEELMLRSLKRE
jgi:glycerol-3-phosphate dehydrogenase